MKTKEFELKFIITMFRHVFFFFSIAVFTSQAISAQGENWRVVTNMPTPRHDIASCVVNGKIYAIGGMSHEYNGQKTFFNLVTRFDPENSVWDTCQSMSGPRVGAYACPVNGKIYLFGGRNNFSSPNISNMFIYDTEADTWSTVTNMPWGTSYAAGCMYDNKIYLFGGLEAGSTAWNPSKQVLRYDPETESWDTLAEMNVARSHFTVNVMNNKIYAFGGMNASTNQLTKVVEVYDPSSDTWELNNPAPSYRAMNTSVRFNDRIWILSGAKNVSSYNNSVDIYEPATDSWQCAAAEDLPLIKMWHPASVIHDSMVYLLGGTTASYFLDIPEMIAFDFPVARAQNDTVLPCESFEILFYEDGDIYITPSGIQAEKATIEAATIQQESGTAGQKITLQMEISGSCWIYGIASEGRLDRGYSSLNIISAVTATTDVTANTSDDGTGDCTVEIAIADAIFNDNCPGSTLVWEMSGATNYFWPGQVYTWTFNHGVTKIVYTLKNGSSIISKDSLEVTVLDDEDPQFIVPPTDTVYRSSDCSYDIDPFITGDALNEWDNCATGIEGFILNDNDTNLTGCDTAGYIIRTLRLDDGNGNVVDQIQIIWVLPLPTAIPIIEKIPDFRFYPNPAEDYITVELPATGDISLFDILGREMTGISNVSGKTTISVSELPQGVYFIRVNYGKEFSIEKVLVE
ncbi:MAG: hypothetical protein AMS27_02840 [Bacteroides sp. SM23_62_1]|nr:MAG: hypothetical protein AMS27_02840 [Bacteroides sp. SM23_62_1]